MTAGFADDPALDEPAWCPPARDRIDEINHALRDAITAERERIDQLARAEAIRYQSEWRDYAARVILDFAALIPQGDT